MAALPGKQVVVEEVSEDESDSGGPAEFERTITGDPEVALAAAQRAIHRAAQRVFGEGLGGKGPSLPMRPATAAQRNGAASDEDVPDLVADDSSNSSSEWDTDEGLSEEELHDSPPTPNKPGAAKGDKAAPNAGFKSASGSRAAPDMASQMEAAQRAYEAQQERDRAFKQTRAAQANQARLDMERRERERAQREEARERAREAKRQRKMARAMQGGAQQAEASSRETPEEREARRQLLEKARMLNAQHDAEERKRLRKELGLDDEEGEGGEAELVLARCALRPGTMGDAKCEADPEGYAIKGHDKYMKIDCSEGCHIAYHWGCWRKVESHLRTAQPDFSWKNKTALACFTDGCSGSITYAITLEGPNGSRSRHEVYKRQAEPSAPSAAAVANDQPDRQAKRREKLGKRGSKNRAEDELAVGKGKGKKLKKRKEKAPKKEVIVLGAASHFSRAPPATPLSPPRPPGPPHIPSHPPHAPPQPHKAAPVAAADPGAAAPRVAEFPTLDMAQELLAKGVSTFSMDPVVAALEQLKVVDEAVATAMVLVECLDVRRIEERGGGQTVEGFLLELFSAHGHVLHLRAFKPQEAAAVEFETEKEAVRAMMHLHDMKVERRPIKLCYLHSFPSQQLMDTLLAEAEQASQQAQRTQQQPQEHYYYHDEHQWDAGQADGSQHWTDWGHEPGYGNGQSVPVNIPQDHLGAHKDAFGGVDLSPMNKPIRTARPASLAGSASDTSSLAKPHLKVTAKEFVPGSSFGSTGSWDAMGGASGVLGLVHQSAAQGNGEVGSVVEAGAAAESGAPAIAPAGEAAKAALLAKRLSIAAPEFKPSLLSREVKAAGLNGAEGSGGVGASGVGADVGDGESSEMGAKVSSISAEANTSMGNGILAGEPSSKQPAAGLAGVQWTGAQLIRCNAESLAIYRSKQSFGIRFADLVDAEAVCKLDTVALVLYHVHTHELHGVWKSRGVVQVDKQGIPIISFRPLKELPALASAVVTHLLKSNANGDVVVPQYLDATKTAALMEAFCPATGAAENDASTTAQAGPPDQPSRKAVDASGGVQPDSAPAAGKATSDSRDGEMRAWRLS
ncbi:hypothetical protein WJX72_002519 [[Myrmecia] bisecta]|uniref:RRM domain-containing protein n=1 Tax=[Myrmecia] bisecta TaxID=41462 RepID=A0AAW1Q0J0_9CHLO